MKFLITAALFALSLYGLLQLAPSFMHSTATVVHSSEGKPFPIYWGIIVAGALMLAVWRVTKKGAR